MTDYNSSFSGAQVDAALVKAAALASIIAGSAGKLLAVNSTPDAFELIHPYFTTGDQILFCQATVPTGWTIKSDWAANASILVGNAYGVGGTDNPVSWTTAVAISDHGAHAHSVTVDSHTLTISEIPSHQHQQTSSDQVGGGSVTQKKTSGAVGSETGDNNSTVAAGGGGGHNHTASSSTHGAMAHSITQDTYDPIYVINICGIRS